MQCIVLCAGFATRLYPLTRHRPKQLLPIGSGCVLDLIMDRLSEAEIRHATLVCNHRFIKDFDQWRCQQPSSVSVELIDNGVTSEKRRLGSVGDLNLALERLNIQEDFWVLHGDNCFTFSLRPVQSSFRRQGNTLVTYDTGSKSRARRAGQVTCTPNGRIVGFVEKSAKPTSTRVSIGVYALNANIRSLISQYMASGLPTDRTGDLMAWLHRRTALFTHHLCQQDGAWFDIGTQSDLRRARSIVQ